VTTLRYRSVIVWAAAALVSPCSVALGDSRVERGRSLLAVNCAECHALGRTGESHLPSAPPFRRIGERMDMEELMTRMREGLSSGHRDMPMFRFSLDDRRAIRSYLNAIQD
jgi:cytochrome c